MNENLHWKILNLGVTYFIAVHITKCSVASVRSQPTNFTNPVYATLYMGAHNSRNSLASTDEKKELLSRGDEEPLVDPLV